jgi:fatty-acyl-CoA synthase
MLAHPDYDPDRTKSLRTGLTLGNEADIRLVAERLAIPRVCNIYGQTETYGNCCVTPASWPLARRSTSQGPPLPCVELSIRDESGLALDCGQVGEIYARSSFAPDGWFATGDLGLLDVDGCLHFAARAAEMIKTGGINVAPSEVEEFLVTHPLIEEAAVVGVDDEHMDQLVVAFVVTGGALEEGQLREWCTTRIAAYKVPARFHLLDRLPETTTGKPDRRRLLDLDRELLAC